MARVIYIPVRISFFSEGMMIETKKNSTINNVVFKQVDIQSIPYNDKEFDMVVANMMLYYVPDLDKGLEEVARVLKNGGKFYKNLYGHKFFRLPLLASQIAPRRFDPPYPTKNAMQTVHRTICLVFWRERCYWINIVATLYVIDIA